MLQGVTEELAKSTRRRTLLWAATGTTLGFAAACFGGPKAVSWLYKPPSQDAFSCAGSVDAALTQFVRLQLTCAVVGAAVSLGLLFFVRRFLRRRADARQASS